MKRTFFIILLFAAIKSNAQLASERALENMYSPLVKQKLQKVATMPVAEATLPGNAGFPKQAVAAGKKANKKEGRTINNGAQMRLPSQSDAVVPAIKYPTKRKQN